MKKKTEPKTETIVIKGYKVFNPEFKCRDMQYEENKEYTHNGSISICNRGLHFCLSAQDCFRYYDFNPSNIVCEVEARGQVQYHEEDSKGCTDILFVGRRLSWEEVLRVANTGLHNAGHSNSGDRNSGDRNSGDRNSGDRNSGDSNSGYRNSGNWNSGNWNSGNWNSGDRNSGDSNSGYRNSGAFCTENNPVLWLFDKPTDIKVKEWESHMAMSIMGNYLETHIWVDSSIMTDEEKSAHPKHETAEGYLKQKSIHEAWADMWPNLSVENKKVFTDLPNFCPVKFKTITGITI